MLPSLLLSPVSASRRLLVLPMLLLVGWAAAAEPARAPGKTPQTSQEKMGYAIGVELASKFRKEKFDFDVEMAAQGLRDAMAEQVQLSQSELDLILRSFQVEMRRKVAQNRHTALMANRERNEVFFNNNKVAEGVKLLPSGVQYRVLKEGSGRKPTDASTVSVNFQGTLLDGTVFDRSEEGKPGRLKVANLVLGWRIAVSAMPAGSRWQVWIPAQLAYGDRGNGEKVGPHEPLVLDIELLDVQP